MFKQHTACQAYEWCKNIDLSSAIDIPSLVAAFEIASKLPTPYDRCGISGTTIGIQSNNIYSDKSLQDQVEAMDSDIKVKLPPIFRPVPPILEPSKDESIWINPGIPIMPSNSSQSAHIWFEFDVSMVKPLNGETAEAIHLLELAVTVPLTRDQLTKLITEFHATPELMWECDISPKKLGQLVENNPKVAIQFLIELSRCPGPKVGRIESYDIENYWMELVNIPITMHSMEVVSGVSSIIPLPVEHLQLFVSNCMAACDAVKDPIAQNRVVTMCCVFFQTLIRHKIILVDDILPAMETFCLNYSGVPCAAVLFRLMKQMQQ